MHRYCVCLLNLLLLQAVTTTVVFCCDLHISCYSTTLKEQEIAGIVVNVSQEDPTSPLQQALFVSVGSNSIASLVNVSKPTDGAYNRIRLENDFPELTITVKGLFVGRTTIVLESSANDSQLSSADLCHKECPVVVLRREQLFQRIFAIMMGVIVFFNTFIMGMQLNWRVMLDTIRRPIPLIIGVVVQYSVQPAAAFGWGQLFLQQSVAYQLAYFAIGSAPGGGSANFWTILLGGNVDVSVALSIVANIVALGLMPLWLLTLGKYIVRGTEIKIPFENILISLALLIVPVGLGMLLAKYKPKAEDFSRKVIKYTSVFVIVIASSVGSYANHYVFLLLTWRTLLCGLLLPWGGYLAGYIAATICRQSYENKVAIALGTGIQKTGIAILLLLVSLDQPDADLAMVLPVSVIMMVPLPPGVCLLVKTVRTYCKTSEKKKNGTVTKDSARAPAAVKKRQDTVAPLPSNSTNQSSF